MNIFSFSREPGIRVSDRILVSHAPALGKPNSFPYPPTQKIIS